MRKTKDSNTLASWCPLTGSLSGRVEAETNIITRVRQAWKERWGLKPIEVAQAGAAYEVYAAWRQDPDPLAKLGAIPLYRPVDGSEIRVNMGNRIVKGADTLKPTLKAIIRDRSVDSSPGDIVQFITGLERMVETAVAGGFEDALRRAEGDTGAEEALARGLLLVAVYEAREGENCPRAMRLLDIAEGKLSLDRARGRKVLEGARKAGAYRRAEVREERGEVWTRWQARADEIWKRHPEWSKRAVAIEIRKADTDRPALSTIRGRIQKMP